MKGQENLPWNAGMTSSNLGSMVDHLVLYMFFNLTYMYIFIDNIHRYPHETLFVMASE